MVEGKLAFPPKRLLNNKEEKLIEARQRGLEMYLQVKKRQENLKFYIWLSIIICRV